MKEKKESALESKCTRLKWNLALTSAKMMKEEVDEEKYKQIKKKHAMKMLKD